VAFFSRFLPFGLPLVLGACSSEPLPTGAEKPVMGAPADGDQEVASLLGGSPTLVAIYDPSDDASGRPLVPTALAWNPTQPDELWITLREPLTDKTCNSDGKTACTWLEGRVAIVSGAAGAPEQPPQIETKKDANAWHFMRRPSSIAWGSDDTFATCGEARTGNYEDEAVPFIGPVLWSADPAIFGVAPPRDSPTGSTHIDMLHESPFCMGIAHETANVYWVFNGDAGSLDRYDFHAPHEPGEDDHSDGEVWRYVAGSLWRVPEVPSHLAYDPEGSVLYAADTGHGRVVALDTLTGSGSGVITTYDPIKTHVNMADASLRVIVPPGGLSDPTGLALYRGVLFVTDHSSSRVLAFDRAGRTLATLETGLPAGALGAIGFGPDGRAYLTDRSSGRVWRVDP
jgi:sugar lactone lactonase YvrE